jgi:8-oxo-dGTP pyrophosphatase MutT (NUDIX family)
MSGCGLIDAATVLLLRAAGSGVEALLVQRHPQLSFMGGLWAFPGGRLEAADHAVGAGAADPVDAAFRHAACRELDEECAIALEPAQLLFFSHWITPSVAPRRFDTRFYLAVTEPTRVVTLDQREHVALRWLSPQAAAAEALAGSLPMSPPTFYVLEDLRLTLALHGSLEQLLQRERTRQVPPITPRLAAQGGGFDAVLPWEPGYAALPGEGETLDARCWPQLARLAAEPLRRMASTLPVGGSSSCAASPRKDSSATLSRFT